MTQWRKTRTQNLLKNSLSGIYYARFRVLGKLKWVSLETTDFPVAMNRLNEERINLAKMREAMGATTGGVATMGQIAFIWKKRTEANVSISESTRKLLREHATTIPRSWQGFELLAPKRVTKEATIEWRDRIFKNGTGYVNPFTSKLGKPRGLAASTVNRLMDSLRQMLDIAVERGQLAANPISGKGLKLPLKPRRPELPEQATLDRLYEAIETPKEGPQATKQGHRRDTTAAQRFHARQVADFCRVINFTGGRQAEAAGIRWADVNWVRREVTLNGTKTPAAQRTIPMIPDLHALLTRLRAGAEAAATKRVNGVPFVNPQSRISAVGSATLSLAHACAALGLKKLTHHDLRDGFATLCIESGVDIPTVAVWMGHKDGGALLMRIYNHLRNEHSQGSAAKVKLRPASGVAAA